MDFTKAILGSFIFCFAINFFVVPNHLYTGGILGISQIIRSFIIDVFKIDISFDFSGIIYYLINVPLFIVAYKSIGKTFFFRTLFAVSIQSIMLSLIPCHLLIDDVLANVVIGGLLSGIGVGMILSSGASTGGTDIVGLAFAKKDNHFSVGKLGLVVNIFIYMVAGLRYGISIMIYSIISSAVVSAVTSKSLIAAINPSRILTILSLNPKTLPVNMSEDNWHTTNTVHINERNIFFITSLPF